jgi:signal transduction histidine kinase
MKSLKKVLLVEDNPGDARLLREMFNEHDTHDSELSHVASMSDAERYLVGHTVDLILLDLGLPDASGIDAIRRIRAAAPGTPLVVLTGMDDESLAAQAIQEGAQDYLIKGQIETRGLLRAMRYANERKRLDRLKDEFVSSVSHELRTPLTSICASLGLLVAKAPGELPDGVARLISIAHTNSQRLVRLVNDILDIEKMDARQVVFKFKRVEVRQLVEQAIEANLGFADTYGVRLQLPKDAIALDDVRADPGRLMQVLTNLLSNAVKFSVAGSVVEVAIEKHEPHSVRISVRDHGPGIPAEFKSRVFERFAQADATSTRPQGGTGLGLTIVKQIVDRTDGEVSFADAPGGGTVFHVDLPCWRGETGVVFDPEAQLDALKRIHRKLAGETAADQRESLQTNVRAAEQA